MSLASRVSQPLTGAPLLAVVGTVWIAGAAYCHGYQRLLSGAAEWPGSLLWSTVAVLPWLALFEWAKRRSERQLGFWALALLATGAASLLIEYAANFVIGSPTAPLPLDILRRLPAVGTSGLLILWIFAGRRGLGGERETSDSAPDLKDLAPSIDWIAAADNYIELHVADRVILRRMTLSAAERALLPFGFVRVHRRFLVNRRRVESIAGSKRIRVAGTELPVGPRYYSHLD